jgi:TolB-like protein/DNA-binding winged helix-turn-helix (wHTH) protein/Tfp pilus assembly protein PilF
MTSSSSAAPASTTVSQHRFGEFELDLRAGELRKDGAPVKLQPQPFRVLALLVTRAGDLVTRDELKKAVWGDDTYVDFERGLNFSINQVRAALGDSADSPRFVQTLPRRGYRFIAGVRPGSDQARPAVREDAEPILKPMLSPFGLGSEWSQSRSTEGLKDPGRTAAGWQILLTGTAFLTILAAGATFIASRTTTTPAAPRPTRTTIAVLPLEDLTGDPPPSWFADGLTDELIAQIGRLSPDRLAVIARTSAMTYRGSGKSIGEIGRELGVSHIVEGSLRREGTRLRVTVQLVSVAGQTPIWGDTYERSAHGALTLQSEIAAQVTRALALELTPARWTTISRAATHDPAARDALLRGKYFLHRGTPDDLRTALGHVEDALRRDPSFAAAHAAHADAHHLLAMFGLMPPAEAYARARVAAGNAVRLDAHLADAHAAMGLVQLWGDWNPAASAASLARAMELNPSDAAAHHDYAWALVVLNRFDEAAAHIARAQALDPVSPRASNDIGWLHLQIRQPSEAIRACRHTLALHPGSIEAQQCIERAHLQRGEFAEAVAAARAAAARAGAPLPAGLEPAAAPREHLLALWRWRLQRLRSVAAERYVSPYTVAMHYAVLGEDDDALTSLEEALRTRAPAMVLLRTDPVFDSLRDSARFKQLLADVYP